MSAIKCGSREIFIDGMDLEVFEGIDGCWTVLPDITDDIIELSSFE
jgi:hypothetical protein